MKDRLSHIIPIILLEFFLLQATISLHAQEEKWISYNDQYGLTRNSINDIVRDPDGFYWLATEKNILRFDGANFVEIAPQGKRFPGDAVQRIRQVDHGLLLVHANYGLQKLDLRNFQLEDIHVKPVVDVAAIGPDTLFILEKDGWLVKTIRGKEQYRRKFRLDGPVSQLYYWHGLLMLVVSSHKTIIINPADISVMENAGPQFGSRGLGDMFSEFGNDLYFFSSRRAMRIKPDFSVSFVQDPSTGSDMICDFICFVRPDRFFYMDKNKLVYEMNQGHAHRIALEGIGNAELRRLELQDSSHILVATNQGLLQIRVRDAPIQNLEEPTSVHETDIVVRRRIVPWKNGTILLMGYPRSYFRNQDNSFRPIVPTQASYYEALLDGNDLYTSTEGGGLVHINLNQPTYDYVHTGTLQGNTTCNALYHRPANDTIFVGIRDSLLAYNRTKQQVGTVWHQPGAGMVRAILQDSTNGHWWLGTETDLVHLDASFREIRSYHPGPGTLSGALVSDLLIDKRMGRLWVASDNGVDIIDRRSGDIVDRVPHALFANPRVTSLLQDDAQRIWMPTYAGIIGIDPETRAYIKLGRENGLTNLEFNYKSAAKLPDGRLIFGGLSGYDVISPLDFEFNVSRPDGIYSAYALLSRTDTLFNNFSKSASPTVSFKVDREALRIFLSSRDIADAALYRYEYNLDGENWVPVKGSPYIDLFNLEPRDYTLQVRAYDEFGAIVTFPVMTVSATVPFLKSIAFVRTLLAVLVLLAGLYIFMLLYQRRREQQLKEKIAMDLHDEVGTILTRTLYLTRSSINSHPEASRVERFLNEALFSLRVYIHTMNRKDFTLGELKDELTDMLLSTLNSAGYETEISIEGDENARLNGEMHRDVKLCVFEMVNNTIRHGGGNRFTFKMKEDKGKLYLSSSDNGPLTDTQAIYDKGNGIRNLLKRVRKHGGSIRFSINPEGHGLHIEVSCP